MRWQTSHGKTPSIWLRRHLILCAMWGALFLPTVGSQAQTSHIDSVPLKNWALSPVRPQIESLAATANQTSTTTGLVFVAITPCRLVDTRPGAEGSGKTGLFGAPALLAGQIRIFPVSQSTCGVPPSAAYSLNFVSITPVGQPVGYISAWPTGQPFPGTVVLNAPIGGIINNAAVVSCRPGRRYPGFRYR